MLDWLALIILIVLLAVVFVVLVKLGALPGKIAEQRGHPQADAIRTCGWLGLISLGILWPLALVWAYSRPSGSGLAERVARLEEALGAGGREGAGS